jgi:hypothetical protein
VGTIFLGHNVRDAKYKGSISEKFIVFPAVEWVRYRRDISLSLPPSVDDIYNDSEKDEGKESEKSNNDDIDRQKKSLDATVDHGDEIVPCLTAERSEFLERNCNGTIINLVIQVPYATLQLIECDLNPLDLLLGLQDIGDIHRLLHNAIVLPKFLLEGHLLRLKVAIFLSDLLRVE